jgi:hypothetical protein
MTDVAVDNRGFFYDIGEPSGVFGAGNFLA